ncbi:MAG: DUF2061 domain-containing protein [Bacteroidales bacterium]|nr:DUF2061 domain-containing protein [Bacteroidales bacterium]
MSVHKPAFEKNKTKKGVNIIKDSPGRSIAKAFSWRFIATGSTFVISLIVLDQTNNNKLEENMYNASIIASIEFFAKIIIYYFHERLWTNIQWGKYWRRSYFGRKLWKRKYRRMHQEIQQEFNLKQTGT